ncbi:HlyD family secretion protein [Pasteurella canis]|uniref:HlyD family secretion protein n=1 Tax=Pasteurella canis TaxID=753 RepID=UPI001320D958|nr:HlyD family efflux transporter periplasmic adaptor subunit [Pasteurella canis]MXN88362.1 HlyD family efflux transporter periplasmic adaptor subunit [Pasteurella canis]GJJ79968.1 glycoside hydrolase family 43 [Pasteurella canis]
MKKISFLLVIIAIGIGFYWHQYHQKTEPTKFAHSNGRLEFSRLDIASLYAGKIDQVFVTEGEYVTKDTLLVSLSSDTLQAQVDTAEARKLQTQQVVKRTLAQIEAQQQQLKTAQLDLDNATQLRHNKLISQTELEKRLALRDVAKANLHALEIATTEAEAAVAQANAQLVQVKSMLNDLQIKAPKAGRVEYKLVDNGHVIPAGHKVVSLLDLTDASMNIFLPAPIVNQIPLNTEARIVFDGLDAVFPARVTYVAAEAQFTPKFVETDTEREKLMFKVKLQIPNDIAQQYANYLKGGMTGNGFVRINTTDWTPELQIKLPK